MNASLTSVCREYVRTVNDGDAAGYLALFAADATVDDAGREFRGQDAIGRWSQQDIFSANVSFKVLNEAEEDGQAVITTEVDGDFDRTGLPDPVVIVHHLAMEKSKIVRLTCRLGS